MTSPDIRAGIALLIAALGAEGNSRIHNIEQIEATVTTSPRQYIDVTVSAAQWSYG